MLKTKSLQYCKDFTCQKIKKTLKGKIDVLAVQQIFKKNSDVS